MHASTSHSEVLALNDGDSRSSASSTIRAVVSEEGRVQGEGAIDGNFREYQAGRLL